MIGRNTLIWRPDTCACALEEEYIDDGVKFFDQKFSGNVFNKCKAHENLTNEQQYDTVLDENLRKGDMRALILEHLNKSNFSNQSDFLFEYNEERVLVITLGSVTSLQKTAIQSLANTKFGNNKVLIQ